MRIQIPFPSLAPHGGTRVAIAIANRLAVRKHDVEFVVLKRFSPTQKHYWRWHPNVRVVNRPGNHYQVRLITSPHSMHLARPRRTVLHLQMLEHMFAPQNKQWRQQCEAMYTHPAPMFSISSWNIEELKANYGRTDANTIYVGNGVDEIDFPRPNQSVIESPRDYILVEGWHNYNPCKDVDRLAPKVAARLKKERKIRIVGYGVVPPTDYLDVLDEFHLCPTLPKMLQLYRGAKFLLKASMYDARSCSPVEAMALGVPTVRALHKGDDDLIGGFNCYRSDYNEQNLFYEAERMFVPGGGFFYYTNMHTYAEEFLSWEPHIDYIERVLLEVGS